MRFIFALAALLLLAPAAAAAQRIPAVVTGRVMVLDSARAAAGVLVRIESANAGVSTDSAGYYRITVPATRFADGDSVTLTASRAGLARAQRRIQLVAGATLQADFGLKRYPLEDMFLCEGVSGTPAGTPPRPPVLSCKLRRLTDEVNRAVRGRSPRRDQPCTTAADPTGQTAAVARGETLEQARRSVNLDPFRATIAGASQLRRFIFNAYVALPGVETAYREAAATPRDTAN